MYITNVTSMPVIGKYDSNIKQISESLANAYNNAIEKVNSKKFLGYDFSLPVIFENKKASFNIEDRVLEIHINENTSVILPSLYITKEKASKYFDIGQQRLFENKLSEISILKGKGGGTKAFKAGMKSARKFFTKSVEIKNVEDIESLAESISLSLNKCLGGNVLDKTDFTEYVKRFIINPSEGKSIDHLYEKMFKSSLQTAKLDKVLNVVAAQINKNRNFKGFLKGKSSIKELEKSVALAYGVDIKDLKARSKSEKMPAVKNFLSRLVQIFKSIVSSFKTVASGGLAYTLAQNGIGKSTLIMIQYVFKAIIKLVAWSLGIKASAKPVGDPSQIGGFYEEFKTKFFEYTDTAVGGLAKAFDFVLSTIGDAMQNLESLPVLKYAKYPGIALLIYLCVVNLIDFVNNIRKLKDLSMASNVEVAGLLSKEELSNNFGLDKILASEMIMVVITEHIDYALMRKKENFTSDEYKRLEMLKNQINKTGKQYCKEGIKLSSKYTQSLIKDFINMF